MNTTVNNLPLDISVATLQKIENINYHIEYHTKMLGIYKNQSYNQYGLIKEQQFMIKALQEERDAIFDSIQNETSVTH